MGRSPPWETALTDRVLIGVVGAPHGVRGEVRVKSFTVRATGLADYGALTAEHPGRPRQRLAIAAMRQLKDDMLVVRFAEVATREAAAALTGARLFVARAALPPPGDEEFYDADLIGLAVSTEEGLPVGAVKAVLNYGAGDILEIERGGETALVPFTRAFVPVVDVGAGRITVTAAALASDEVAAEAAAGSAAGKSPR